MAALGIPYIQTTALNYSWYRDLIKATTWAVDGVHPDMAHTKVYARLVLFGAVPREEVIDTPQKAAASYVYRLEILSRAPGDTSDRVWTKTLSATPAPAEIFGSSNRTGFMDPTVLTSAYNDGSVGYVNLDGDFPFNITWSSTTELQSLSYLPDAARKGTGNYRRGSASTWNPSASPTIPRGGCSKTASGHAPPGEHTNACSTHAGAPSGGSTSWRSRQCSQATPR